MMEIITERTFTRTVLRVVAEEGAVPPGAGMHMAKWAIIEEAAK